MTDYKPQERQDLEELYRKQNVRIYELEQENAKLKDRIITDDNFEEKLDKENKKLKEEVRFLEECLDRKEKLNEKYRKEIDELKFREDIADIVPEGEGHIAEETIQDLQARIKELNEENETLKEELISRIRQPKNVPYGKGVAELMEEDTLQELRDLGEI